MALPSVEDVRAEVKQWLEDNWNPDLTVAEWWDILARSGYAAPTFPEDCWGKGWPRDLAIVVSETIAAARRDRSARRPRLPARGADDRRARQRAPAAGPTCSRILNGQDAWCQLFSEPGAGSDLASLTTKAVQGRRRVGHHRPEGVDVDRAAQQPRHAHRAHRPRPAEAQGHHVLHVRHGRSPASRSGRCAR